MQSDELDYKESSMGEPLPATGVLYLILEWSRTRPDWQRDALRRIVQKGRLGTPDLKELVDLCKAVRAKTKAGVSAAPLDATHIPSRPPVEESVSLLSVEAVSGVNNLAPAQTLGLAATGLTVIYGDNGSGKSGYARILKNACRARHDGVIEPNAYMPNGAAQARPTATIAYAVGGVPETPVNWSYDDEAQHPALSAVSVFDSECAAVHLQQKNPVAFTPFGLDIPDALAEACKGVKKALTEEAERLKQTRNQLFLKPPWKAHTAVGKLMTGHIKPEDILKISALATLSDEEQNRLSRLKEDLSKDPLKAAAEQRAGAVAIKAAGDAIHGIEEATADATFTRIIDLQRDAKGKREAARRAAQQAFGNERLSGVGDAAWQALWEAARRYSTDIANPEEPFPPNLDGSLCVLCQQALSPDALARMRRFETFIKEDIERQAQAAEDLAKTAQEALQRHYIGTRQTAASIAQIGLRNPTLAKQVRRFIAAARLRRQVFFKGMAASPLALPNLPEVPASPSPLVTELEAATRRYATELQSVAGGQERRKLEAELAELADRVLLRDAMQIVAFEIQRLTDLSLIEQCLLDTSTTAITRLGNDIADAIVTPQLRDRFQREIVQLAGEKVRVEIVRAGGESGTPNYQVRLFAKPEAKIAAVLSEGEKMCVALAAFLTDLATAAHRSSLVFDDPVCSLDHRWRRQVAIRLGDEAATRQIVVFTHDLVFVNDLVHHAERLKQSPKLITLSREAAGAGVVNDGLPWKIKSVEDRLDKLEKEMRAAKTDYDSNAEERYRQQATSIYNNLRATWERALEDVAFSRVIQRHRDYIDTKSLKKVSVLSDVDCEAFRQGFQKCCDVVDAHDPSVGRNAEVPAPRELMADIASLRNWVESIRKRQALVAT